LWRGIARFARARAQLSAPRPLVERLRLLPQLLAGCGWTSLPWLRLLAQPTLVMAGTDDPLVPFANGRILASLIRDARLVTIDDGHLFLVTKARESAGMISEFLS